MDYELFKKAQDIQSEIWHIENPMYGGWSDTDMEKIKNAKKFGDIANYLGEISFDIEPLKQILINYKEETKRKVEELKAQFAAL